MDAGEQFCSSTYSRGRTTKQDQTELVSSTTGTCISSSSEPQRGHAGWHGKYPDSILKDDFKKLPERPWKPWSNMNEVGHEQVAATKIFVSPSAETAVSDVGNVMRSSAPTDCVEEHFENARAQQQPWSKRHDAVAANVVENNDAGGFRGRYRRQDQRSQRDLTRHNLRQLIEKCNLLEEGNREYQKIHESLVKECQSLTLQNEALTAHCNELVKQNEGRQSRNPHDEELRITRNFRKLNAAVKTWCLNAWDLNPSGQIKLVKFPLSDGSPTFVIRSCEPWLLIAGVWEWLLYGVIGADPHPQQQPQVLDLWADLNTAQCMKHLETRVKESQKEDTLREWRSFTVQCLFTDEDNYDQARGKELTSRIIRWFLHMINSSENESTAVQNLQRSLEVEVVIPAVAFHGLLRQCSSTIWVRTPITIEEAVSCHEFAEAGSKSPLEIAVYPELRKLDCNAAANEPREIVLAEAFRYTIAGPGEKITESKQEEANVDTAPSEPFPPRPPSSSSKPSSIYKQMTELRGGPSKSGTKRSRRWLESSKANVSHLG